MLKLELPFGPQVGWVQRRVLNITVVMLAAQVKVDNFEHAAQDKHGSGENAVDVDHTVGADSVLVRF